MIDTTTTWFNALATMFAALLTHPEFSAVVVGTLSSISITQTVKMIVIQSAIPNGGKGLWYGVTTLVGLTITTLLWPTVLGFSFGLCVGGLFAPCVYLIGTRTLYKFWPELESRISATPRE